MKKLVKAVAVTMICALLTALTFTLSGCWDARELDTLAMVTGVGIDAIEGSDELLFSFQIGKVQQAAGGSSTQAEEKKPFAVMQVEEQGLMYAIKRLRNKTSRQLLLHHNQVLIISREVAERGVLAFLDAFVRERQMRTEIWVIVADGRADELLSEEMDQEKISGLGISIMLDDLIKISEVYDVQLQRFISNVISETSEPIAPVIKLIKRENSTEFSVDSFVIFKEGKAVGEFGIPLSRGVSWIKDYLKVFTVELPSEEGFATVEMSNFHNKMKADFTPEGAPLIKLNLKCDFEILEIQGFKGWNKEEISFHLEQVASKMIVDETNAIVDYCQSLDSDIFGFGTEYHKRHQKKWKTMKENWSEHFANLTMEVDAKASFIDEGKISDVLENTREKEREKK
ncbi:MAG: Ger(x)C family spore germination protein [Clostridia bacterium]